MNLDINDIIDGYNAKVTELAQQLVLAEAQIKALERRLAELDKQSTEEDA